MLRLGKATGIEVHKRGFMLHLY